MTTEQAIHDYQIMLESSKKDYAGLLNKYAETNLNLTLCKTFLIKLRDKYGMGNEIDEFINNMENDPSTKG